MSTALSLHVSDSTPALAFTPTFAIPIADLREFGALPEARRNEVQAKLAILRRLHDLRGHGSFVAAAETIAAQYRHTVRGVSKSRLFAAYYAYMGSHGDWHVLVNAYKSKDSEECQPKEFRQEVKRIAELNHRSIGAALDKLRSRWESGESIPGYGTWIEYYMSRYPERPLPKHWPRGFYPAGWSPRNLRRYGPSKGTRVLFQQGLAAAKKYFPSVKRDPSGLRPMELIVIDDFELDCLCAFPGDKQTPPQITGVAGLLAKCVGTRRSLVWGVGPRLVREEKQPDGTTKLVRSGIRRIDVQGLIHDLFAKFGLPDYPITILCENATASISPELELSMSTLFEGRVRIERTGLINQRTLANGYVERGGKPWEKGWIESFFNSLWNSMGDMPGYKGSNARLNGPANIDDAINVTKLLLGQGERSLNLPSEKIALLRLPFPSPEAVERTLSYAIIQSDLRTNHKYLGFDRVTEFRLEDGSEPQPFTNLALVPFEQQSQVELIERMESPLERWQRIGANVTWSKIPESVLAIYMLTPKRVTYRNSAITFTHEKVGYSYVDPEGKVLQGIPEETELLAYFDPAAPQSLHLADMQGSFVGTLARLGGRKGMIDIRDKAALSAAGGVVAEIVNRAKEELRERHADADAQLAIDRAYNAQIVADHKAETAKLTTAERIAIAATQTARDQVARQRTETAISKAGAGLDISSL